jgi:hypothetical protein
VNFDAAGLLDSSLVTPPARGINLLANDWRNANEWFALLQCAELEPCRFVLTQGTYREANPRKVELGLTIRSVLLATLATSAITGLGNSQLLEGKGFWPRGESATKSVSHALAGIAVECIELVSAFLVEDEESLDSLARACERSASAARQASSKWGEAAYQRVNQALLVGKDEALAKLRSAI